MDGKQRQRLIEILKSQDWEYLTWDASNPDDFVDLTIEIDNLLTEPIMDRFRAFYKNPQEPDLDDNPTITIDEALRLISG